MAEDKVLTAEMERFAEICRSVRSAQRERDGIGTYMEKSVHLALKIFFEPDENFREVPVGGYIADIKNEWGIHEIQTSGFGSLKRKLEEYLSCYMVEIIYPVIEKSSIMWVSPDTGEVVRRHASTRRRRPAEIFKELLYLGESLYSPGLSFTIVSLEAEELRLLDGYGGERKRRATKVDKFPTRLTGIRRYASVYQMTDLFEYSDGDLFTGDDIRKFLRAPGRSGWAALKVMEEAGIAVRCGREGRRIVYKFCEKSSMGC